MRHVSRRKQGVVIFTLQVDQRESSSRFSAEFSPESKFTALWNHNGSLNSIKSVEYSTFTIYGNMVADNSHNTLS